MDSDRQRRLGPCCSLFSVATIRDTSEIYGVLQPMSVRFGTAAKRTIPEMPYRFYFFIPVKVAPVRCLESPASLPPCGHGNRVVLSALLLHMPQNSEAPFEKGKILLCANLMAQVPWVLHSGDCDFWTTSTPNSIAGAGRSPLR